MRDECVPIVHRQDAAGDGPVAEPDEPELRGEVDEAEIGGDQPDIQNPLDECLDCCDLVGTGHLLKLSGRLEFLEVLVDCREEPQVRIPDEDHGAIGLRSPYDVGEKDLHLPKAEMSMIDVVPKEGRGKDTPEGKWIVVIRRQSGTHAGAGTFGIVEKDELTGVRNDHCGARIGARLPTHLVLRQCSEAHKGTPREWGGQ
jgi:hypothetical protein